MCNTSNIVYLADKIVRDPVFTPLGARLMNVFRKYHIPHDFIRNTKDVWARDFMPVQTGHRTFTAFRYHPSYLHGHRHRETNGAQVFPPMKEVQLTVAPLIVDGGNIVRHNGRVIMTERVFDENKGASRERVSEQLALWLNIPRSNLIIIPCEPPRHDMCGHADGIVRFLDDKTVLVNDYPNHPSMQYFWKRLRPALESAGLKYEFVPYRPPVKAGRKTVLHEGLYINFLRIGNRVFVPLSGRPEDRIALRRFRQLFPSSVAITGVDAREAVAEGGALNCVIWDIVQ